MLKQARMILTWVHLKVLYQIGQVLEIVKSIKSNPTNGQHLESGTLKLNEDFLASIQQDIKPGLKSD
jgi:hypothetical protein